MEYFLVFIGFYVWFAFWSAQAGYSMTFLDNILQKWQQSFSFGNRVPEFVIALTISAIATWGFSHFITDINASFEVDVDGKPYDLKIFIPDYVLNGLVAVVSFFIALGGKESATWAYLPGSWRGFKKDKNLDGIIDEQDARNSTLFPVNVFLGKIVGQKFGDKYFSWVWAFTKGTFTTLPVLGTGGLMQPLSREVAFRIGGGEENPSKWQNFWMESVGDGAAYAFACTLFIVVIKIITG